MKKGVPVSALRSDTRENLEKHIAHAFAPTDQICTHCLTAARVRALEERLVLERGALTELESQVARKAEEHETIARHVDEELARNITFGQRLADSVARVGGSWPFVITFVTLLVCWTLYNTFLLRTEAFDPYPYILLNLLLSCVAALQAPVIMMSQNRRAERDRLQADQDYRVNLKAELEIGALHDKLDHLLHTRWESMIEMQHAQLELLEELTERRTRKKREEYELG